MTHEQLQGYYTKLDNLNNHITNRYIRIEKNGKLVVDLNVILTSSKPLINTPPNLKSNMEFFRVDHEIGKYQDYSFKEGTILNLKKDRNNLDPNPDRLSPQEEADYLAKRLDTDGQSLSQGRYIPYLTIINPVTRTDITILIDKKHGDMFCIAGLNLILDDIVINKDRVRLVRGYRIGGAYSGDPLVLTDNITPSSDVSVIPNPDIGKNFEYANLLNQDSDVSAYGIVFTKELPANSSSPNFPTVYDFLTSPTGTKNVQVARQDSYPCIYIQLGKLNKFFKASVSQDEKKVYNWNIISNHITRISLSYNDNVSSEETILGLVLNLY